MTRAAVKHLEATGGGVINTTSINAYRDSGHLLDHQGRDRLADPLAGERARRARHPRLRRRLGPIWTPLIPATFPEEAVQVFGEKPPMSRMGQPAEVAPCYVFLASPDAPYMTGQILHPNGGDFTST